MKVYEMREALAAMPDDALVVVRDVVASEEEFYGICVGDELESGIDRVARDQALVVLFLDGLGNA
ncbi:MAG: hypothetical protein AB7G23_02900 [Vicinamibacterales bacterium]